MQVSSGSFVYRWHKNTNVARRVIDPTDPASVIDHYHPLKVFFFVRTVLKVGPIGHKSPTINRLTEKLSIIIREEDGLPSFVLLCHDLFQYFSHVSFPLLLVHMSIRVQVPLHLTLSIFRLSSFFLAISPNEKARAIIGHGPY